MAREDWTLPVPDGDMPAPGEETTVAVARCRFCTAVLILPPDYGYGRGDRTRRVANSGWLQVWVTGTWKQWLCPKHAAAVNAALEKE